MTSESQFPTERRLSSIRRAMRLANANAAIWAVGNGLVSTQLVVYLASEFGAKGLWISLILAAPRFAGLLRLASPALIARTKNRKQVCINAYLASAIVLSTITKLAPTSGSYAASTGLAAPVAVWSIYHLCEFVGTVALWSWLGRFNSPPHTRALAWPARALADHRPRDWHTRQRGDFRCLEVATSDSTERRPAGILGRSGALSDARRRTATGADAGRRTRK